MSTERSCIHPPEWRVVCRVCNPQRVDQPFSNDSSAAYVSEDSVLLDVLENEKILRGSYYPFDGVWRVSLNGDEYEGRTLRDALRSYIDTAASEGASDAKPDMSKANNTYTDLVSDGGMDPRTRPTTPTRGSDE